jgi:hypothetical protein
MTKDPVVEEMTERAAAVSRQIQALLHGLGPHAQGAVMADLVSLWIAGHIERSELGNTPDNRPLTDALRHEIITEWMNLVVMLLPASENEILARIEAEGHA